MLLAEIDAGCFAMPDVFVAEVPIAGPQDAAVLGPVHRKVALILAHQAASVTMRDPPAACAYMSDGPVRKFYPITGH